MSHNGDKTRISLLPDEVKVLHNLVLEKLPEKGGVGKADYILVRLLLKLHSARERLKVGPQTV